jgi:hypothetical protein
MSQTYQQLSEPFPREMEKILKKGGASLTYIPVSEVIARMNRVLGVNGWNSQVIKVERDALDPDFIVAHVQVTATIDGVLVAKDGLGGQTVKRKKDGGIVDLGDEYKGAVSDAFKKACQMLGVGLYLARAEEAMDVEAEMNTPAEPVRTIDPEIEQLWKNFLDAVKQLDDDGKKALNEFWAEWGEGRPKPKIETAEAVDLEALIAEATRLSFGGEYVE